MSRNSIKLQKASKRGMSGSIGGIYEMCNEGDGYMIIDSEEEGDLDFYPIDSIELSTDTEWFFEGAWLSLLQLVDHTFPSIVIGDPMCMEDEDGGLGVWVRFDCGISALWLKIMTFTSFHWVWSDAEYH
jgi:hypothetical protein